jgi:hypothetical protein
VEATAARTADCNGYQSNKKAGVAGYFELRHRGHALSMAHYFARRANLLGQAALMPRGLVRRLIAVNNAFVDHAVDDRRGAREGRGGLSVLAGLERQGGLTDGAAQLRGERVVPGAMHGRLPGSFFSRFRIRQA